MQTIREILNLIDAECEGDVELFEDVVSYSNRKADRLSIPFTDALCRSLDCLRRRIFVTE